MKIKILGNGNVASHLYWALSGKAEVFKFSARDFSLLESNSEIESSTSLPCREVYIICVSDNAIEEVSRRLQKHLESLSPSGCVVCHTSGSTPRSVLDDKFENPGVLYPMQTFSKDVKLDYSGIPFFVDAGNNIVKSTLFEVAHLISDNVNDADSETLTTLHVAAVLSCNFTNHLWSLTEEYLNQHGLDFHTMLPLINETCRKIQNVPPKNAQTGPAARKDFVTLKRHMQHLKDNGENNMNLIRIYELLSDSIINKTGKI